MNSWYQYDNNISDHRLLLLKLNFNNFTDILEIDFKDKKLLKIVDIFGRKTTKNTRGTLFYIYKGGVVEKKNKILKN